MPQPSHLKFVHLILYLCWTSQSALSQELNNFPNSGSNEKSIGFSYFFYQQPEYPRDCAEARNQCSTNNLSGVYLIKPDGYPEPFEVYCDNAVDSAGWTVIHRIQDGPILFYRNWTEYKIGFGFLSQEFWIGNHKLSYLTNQKTYELRIDSTTVDGQLFYVKYNKFRISDEHGEYKLTSVGEYNRAGDVINRTLCPPNTESKVYTSPYCTQRCYCTNGRFTCDNTYRCSPNAVCEERNNGPQCYCNEGYIGDGVNCTIDILPSDCKDVYDRVSTESGVYKIKPTRWQGDPFDVFCNMTDGGGWTVFQRRVNGSQDFYLYWSDYKNGFGTPDHELWLGNDKLHSVTAQGSYELRIDFVNRYGAPYYAKYSSITISDRSDNYRLRIGSYSGDAGDSLTLFDGQAFTSRDHDNDQIDGNCANTIINDCSGSGCRANAGWWYKDCGAPLNAPYGTECFKWHGLPGSFCNIKYTEMKVRPI